MCLFLPVYLRVSVTDRYYPERARESSNQAELVTDRRRERHVQRQIHDTEIAVGATAESVGSFSR